MKLLRHDDFTKIRKTAALLILSRSYSKMDAIINLFNNLNICGKNKKFGFRNYYLLSAGCDLTQRNDQSIIIFKKNMEVIVSQSLVKRPKSSKGVLSF
ncbi:hypothetical protein BpHYR1_043455 [Brachionus plicatilis]|uniref:Uncharacterized protein n=1 Tax=Brachionus plicatilis TaxID=10195 RepID=A0A3M7RP41_BRAPC|nr:hypothetical protein BpHYR1_043455 [Brachionus plicatilis]